MNTGTEPFGGCPQSVLTPRLSQEMFWETVTVPSQKLFGDHSGGFTEYVIQCPGTFPETVLFINSDITRGYTIDVVCCSIYFLTVYFKLY